MTEPFDQWARLSLLGHKVRVGRIREEELFGGKMLRIDVPVNETEFVTEYYGIASVYSIEPASEELIRAEYVEDRLDPRPIRPTGYRESTALPAPGDRRDHEDYSDGDES